MKTVIRMSVVGALATAAVLMVVSVSSAGTPVPASVSLNGWDTVSDSWTTGNTVQYSEGDVIPFRLDVSGLSTGTTYTVNICREFQNGTHFGFLFLDEFNTTVPLTNAEVGGTVVDQPGAFAGVNTTVTNVTTVNGPGSLCGPQERLVTVDFTVSSTTTAYLLWGGHLASPIDQVPGAPAGTIVGFGNGAGSYPGSSLAMRLVSPDKTVPVPINKIIILSKITVKKVVVGGTALPENWNFTISGPNLPAGYTPTTIQVPTGGDTIEFLSLPSGAYTITESSVAGYSLTSVTGTNCGPLVLAQGTGTATVTAQTGAPITASCVFTNTFSKQTPTVATDIHSGPGASDTAGAAAITSAPIGSTVHDKATVSGVAGFPTPTGNVSFTVYSGNTTCSGTGASAGSVALSSGVAHPSSDSTVPAGGLSYKAHYDGNTIYNAADGPCEPLTGTKLNSTTATDVHNTAHSIITSAAIGSTVHDKATVTGTAAGGTPSGNVTFTVYMGNTTCSGTGAAAGTVTLNGSGVADPSDTATVPAGGLSYQAHYNGSTIYNESTGPCEPLAPVKLDTSTATDVHNVDHVVITHAPIGSTVHDRALVTGTTAGGAPTGTVSFTVYMGNTTCSGTGTAAGTVALDGSAVAHPSNTAVVPVGGLSYKAHYNGSATYNESDGPCEPLAGDKLNSTTVTDIHNAAHDVVTSVAAGTTVHDKATVSGALTTPTGDVTFKWFTNGTCAGTAAATSGTFALSGGSVDATTFSFTPSVSGAFSFQAVYAGNDTYNGSTGACEPLNVGKLGSSTATDIHNGQHQVVLSVPAGTTVHDKATVTGALSTPTGTVTFKWFTNGACEGDAAATSTAQTLSGGSVDATGFTFTPGAAGSFAFQATYSGDDTYNGSTGPCEPLTVTKLDSSTATDIHNGQHQVVLSVPAGTTVHDKATVTGALSTPTGTVTFKWFTNGTCDGVAVATSDPQDLSGGAVDATGFTFTPGASGSFAFQATYSGNGTYNGSTGPCEPLTVTKLDSSTATDIHNANHEIVTQVAAGTTVHDKATVSGALSTPTGTVTFKWFTNGTCDGAAAATSTAQDLSGGSVDATGFTFTPNSSGNFAFQATYSGNGTYNGSTGPCEPLEVGKLGSSTATDIHNADHEVVLSVPAGTTVHDKATVTGQQGLPTPTGTVTFKWFLNGTCEGGAAATSDPVALSGGSADATAFTFTPTVAGSRSFQATYSGDGTYNASTGACEPLTITKVNSSTATDIHSAAHAIITSAPLGSTVHDKATVTGQQGLPTPTGNVSFAIYSNTQCEGEGSSAGTVALDGGVAHPSDPAVVGLTGLSYKATYAGDGTYNGSTGPCEPLQVEKGTLTVVKDFVGSAEDATVTLRIRQGESTLESGQRADGGSISKILPPGTYTADEISGEGDVDLDLYNSSIKCTDGESTLVDEAGTSADVDLGNGDDITCTITNRHVLPQIAITKTPNPSNLTEPGGSVQFTLLVTNTSSIDPITITSLVDDKFGNLNADCGIPGSKWDLAPLAQATCTFTRNVQGSQSNPHKDTVTATGVDDGGNQATAQASATVTFTPPPPSPIIDLAVTKVDDPDPVALNGRLTYTMVVKNNGPFTATQVTAADPLPEGTSFVSVSTTQGTCANNAGLIQCSIGTMPSGATVTITLVVTATRVGTLTNTVTVVGKEPESNTANNTATATTLVPAPLVPPKPQPKPPVVCYTFTVSSKTLTVGKKGTLVVTVRNRGKAVRGATVVVTGQGIKKTAKTGKDGKARITITPKKAGIITIRVPQTIVCGARRVGVVGAFEPPVTG